MPPPEFVACLFHFVANMRQGRCSGKLFFSLLKIPGMNIQHKDGQHRSMFYIEDEGEIVAELVYASGGDGVIIIEHTEVDDELKGQNVGYALVNRTVEYARSHGLKISPVCPFAKAVFDKRADFKDVLI